MRGRSNLFALVAIFFFGLVVRDTLNTTDAGVDGGAGAEVPAGNGDVNCDGSLNLADAIYLLEFLFRGTQGPPCAIAGSVDLEKRVETLENLLGSLQTEVTELQSRPGTAESFPTSSRGGMAILYPDGRLQRVDGTFINVSNSHSDGIQELFDYCHDNFCDAYIVGGVEDGTRPQFQIYGPVVYNVDVPLTLAPQQGFRLETGQITININSNVGSANGLTIESAIITDIEIHGQIVYFGRGHAVAFKPTLQVPLDPVTAVSASNYFIGQIAVLRPTPTSPLGSAVLFEGPVAFNTFTFNEILGGRIGIHVRDSLTEAGNYARNKLVCRQLHGQELSAVRARGTGGGNIWELFIEPDDKDPIGIDTGIRHDIWFANLVSRGATSLVIQPSGSKNQFHLMEVQGGVQDNGTSNIIYRAP